MGALSPNVRLSVPVPTTSTSRPVLSLIRSMPVIVKAPLPFSMRWMPVRTLVKKPRTFVVTSPRMMTPALPPAVISLTPVRSVRPVIVPAGRA